MNKILFLLFNFLISSNLLFETLLYGFLYTIYLIYRCNKNIEPLGLIVYYFLAFSVLVWIFKVLIFIILSQIKHKDTYMEQFFERIKNERKYKFKVILSAILCDFLCVFIIPICLCIIKKTSIVDLLFFDILGSVFWGGGVTLSYLSLIIWFKINKKLSKNAEDRQHH